MASKKGRVLQPYTHADRERVIQLHNDGVNDRTIAAALGRGYWSLAQFRRRTCGVLPKPPWPSAMKIDPDDAERFSSARMYETSHGYVRVIDGGSVEYLHRLITCAPKGAVVDHINGDGLDNRKSNLRVTNQTVNMANRTRNQANNRSGFRGVCYIKEKRKWRAEVNLNNKSHHLGYYSTPEEAGRVTREWRLANMPGASW